MKSVWLFLTYASSLCVATQESPVVRDVTSQLSTGLTPSATISSKAVVTPILNSWHVNPTKSATPPDAQFTGTCSAIILQYQKRIMNVAAGNFQASWYSNPTDGYMCDVMRLDARHQWMSWSPGNYLPDNTWTLINEGYGSSLPKSLFVRAGTVDSDKLYI